MAQFTCDSPINIFTIKFKYDWTANNYKIDANFTFYAFVAFKNDFLSKRSTGQVNALANRPISR